MVDIWINPARPDNPAVKRNWTRTMNRPVQFTADPYASAIEGPILQALSLVHPTGATQFWGARKVPTQGMAGGDIIAFTGSNRAYCLATVGVAFSSRSLGSHLWPGDEEWVFVYSLLDVVECDISYDILWTALGYATNYAMRSLTLPNRERGTEGTKPQQESLHELFADYIESSDAREVTLAQQLNQRLGAVDTDDSSSVTVELPVQQQHARYTIRRNRVGNSIVERAEAALVLAYTKTLESPGVRERGLAGETDLVFTRDGHRTLVEAKAAGTTTNIRQAIGQLLHYGLYPVQPFDLYFVLLGEEPKEDLRVLLHHYGIGYIFLNTLGQFSEVPASEIGQDRLRKLVAVPSEWGG